MLVEFDPHPYIRFWLDVADAIIKFIALLVGAAWTWMNYKRGRTYIEKPVLEVGGKLFTKSGQSYLSILCRLENVGHSKCPIIREGTTCRVWMVPRNGALPPNHFSLKRVFTEHGWTEPGARIQEMLLVPMPEAFDLNTIVAFRIGLRVIVPGGRGSGNIESNTSCIVELPDVEKAPGSVSAVGDTPNKEGQ